MKKLIAFLATLFVAFSVQAKGAKDTSQTSEDVKTKTGVPFIMDSEENARILRVMAKIRRGERVNIAAFGGSITTGYNSNPMKEKSWASQVAAWWKSKGETYGADVHFYNEGVSGTDSAWGAARTKMHLLQNNVDLVHLEFAMNDQWLEKQVRSRSYEGVIRQLQNDSPCAILALFVNEKSNGQPSQQAEQEVICKYYNIPFVSWKDCEKADLGQKVNWQDYFDGEETVHPNNAGHARIASFIIRYLEAIWETLPQDDKDLPSIKTELPAPLSDTSYQFAQLVTVDNGNVVSNSGWKNGSPVHQEWVSHGGASSGWSSSTDNAELVLKVHGSSVNVLYSESDSFRNAVAWVEKSDGSTSRKITLECMNPIRQGYLGWASRELVNSGNAEEDFLVHILCPRARTSQESSRETNVCALVVTHTGSFAE